MNKKILSVVGMIVGLVFVLVGILSLSGALDGETSNPSSAPYSYDAGYAVFGADYYTYTVNNSAEAASAARTAAGNLDDIADFLKNFCGWFSMCFGVVIFCCFGIYHAGLKEVESTVATETTTEKEVEEEEKEEIVTEEVVVEETAVTEELKATE